MSEVETLDSLLQKKTVKCITEYKDLYKTEHGKVITLQETQTRIQETQTRLQETQTRPQQTQTTLVTALDNILATVDSLKEDRVTVNILQWMSKPESNRY
jgi:hypothetical protein